MNFKLRSLIFILPVAFSWLAVSTDVQLVLVSLVVMAAAEVTRQYLSATVVGSRPEAPRQLFFFGVIYKDSHGFFLNRKPNALAGLSLGRRLALLVAVFILTLGLRFSSAFAEIDFIYSAFFSLIITFWVYCSNFQALGKVLLGQVIGTCAAFAALDEVNIYGFLFWLVMSLWVQMQLHIWQQNESANLKADENAVSISGGDIFKSFALAVVVILCFRTADFIVPEYGESSSSVSKNSAGGTSQSATAVEKKTVRVPKKLLSNLAKFKLQAGALDFNKLNVKDVKVPSGGAGDGLFKLPGFKFSFGENSKELEEIRNNLAGDKPVKADDLNKLSAIARKIKLSPPSGGSGSRDLENTHAESSGADHTDKIIEDRIERLKGYTKAAGITEDDAAAYAKARRELADEIEKMLKQDQKNTLENEELKLEKYFEKILTGLKRFSVLILAIVLLTWWFSKKAAVKKAEETGEDQTFTIPKEARVRLKSLYKMLLKAHFSPRDEVIKSYHLVDLAFREFEFARQEDLPPMNFLEKLKAELPFVSKPAEKPIDLFCKVFYGDKIPVDKEIVELRASMRELMKKLRVI